MGNNFKPGQRVEIVSGLLQGEKATITPNPENGWYEDKGKVWLKFDRDGAHLNGWIMSQQWFEMAHLSAI